MSSHHDTIAAIATPPGKGGVGIIRISGKNASAIARKLLGKPSLKPRYAHYGNFYEQHNQQQQAIDQGIALYFPGPHSFTGEDVLELQGHGGPIILDCLLREVLRLGARMARPGEFSERAFLNNKIDLAQAEAIADLIESSSEQAARHAVRSLEGEFSTQINILVENITQLRIFVEAAIDFPEEEIDFIGESRVKEQLDDILSQLNKVYLSAQQGSILREGMTIVIAGKPNAGKSSLLNALAGQDSAIVTNIAGTTRDILREKILIDGIPLHIIDTAGLHQSDDPVEKEGIKRAWSEIEKADHILLVVDSQTTQEKNQHPIPQEFSAFTKGKKISVIYNKCDLIDREPCITKDKETHIYLSAKQGQGLDLLRQHLKSEIGYSSNETPIIARRRHIDALQQGQLNLENGIEQLNLGAGELLAEELRLAQHALAEITGSFSSDELLGKIFSSFCIGK